MKRLPCRPDRWGVSPLRVLAIAGCLVVLPLRGVQAERIAMAVSSRVVGTNLILQINNQGDAVARNVSVEVSFDGVDIDSRPIAVVSPQSSFGASMDLHVPAMPGNYPALVRLHFEDENAYPFSSTIVQTVPFGMQRSSPITLTLAATSVRGRTTLPLILVNRGDKPITATVRVLGAVELMIRASAAPKIIPPDGVEQVVWVDVDPYAALPGSSYPIHALVEFESEGYHYLSSASARVDVLPPKAFNRRGFWWVLGGLAIIVGLGVIKRPRRA